MVDVLEFRGRTAILGDDLTEVPDNYWSSMIKVHYRQSTLCTVAIIKIESE